MSIWTPPSFASARSVAKVSLRWWIIAALAVSVSACSAFPRLQTGVTPPPRGSEVSQAEAGARSRTQTRTAIDVLTPPAATTPPTPAPAKPPAPTPEEVAAIVAERSIDVSIPAQPLPQFIDTVFGGVLRTPYFTGPGVSQRRDIITLRGAGTMSSRRFFEIVRTALEEYGVAVSIERGVVRLTDVSPHSSDASLIVRNTPSGGAADPSRTVMHYVELKALDVASVMALVTETYQGRNAVRITPRADINTIIISGAMRDVASAVAVIDQIDQPKFAGGRIARIEPVYWSAEGLSQSVIEALAAEGYRVGAGAAADGGPLTLLPVPFANQVLVFANNAQLFARALFWAEQLDTPSALGDRHGVFVYTVQNTSAVELGALVSRVLDAESRTSPETSAEEPRSARTSARRVATAPNSTRATSSAAPVEGGRITVDAGGNRLLFRGSPSQFEQARALMAQLDTPPRQVLVEITIAEVTLTDETRFGVDWYLQQTIGSAGVAFDTRGGSSREPGGLGASYARAFTGGRVEAALNALAENRNLNILSTPRLVARSGSEAQILVGSDVPIITSQRAADNQTGGDTDILQTVQYRQTGVILNMRPVVYGNDRIDIEIYQEVSSQEPNRTSAISSPLILNRSVTTQLSLREGMTAVIGGLIQDNYSREQRGVPILKDAPLVGAAFRSDAVSGSKVELLLLVTPHILRSDEEVQDAAATYAAAMNRALRLRGPRVYTLLPWRSPFAQDRVHGGDAVDPRGAHGVNDEGPVVPAAAATPATTGRPGDVVKDEAATDEAPAGTNAAPVVRTDTSEPAIEGVK